MYGEPRCLIGAKESLQVYDAGETVPSTPMPTLSNTGAPTNKIQLVDLLPHKVEMHIPACTIDDSTPAGGMYADVDGSSSGDDSLTSSPTLVPPGALHPVNPLLPPLTLIILPLKHLVVQYLKGCNSELVNPVVLNAGDGGQRLENLLADDNHDKSLADNRDQVVDSNLKNLNSQNVLDYNEYLLSTMMQ